MPGVQAPPPINIEQILTQAQYNPDIVPDLESYLQEQIVTQSYNLDANLCLLRLYQFEPHRANIQVLVRVLVKGLMAMPAVDFQSYMCLIPERLHAEEPFRTLSTLAGHLETCRFREFWEAASRNRDLWDTIPGFEAAIQGYAVHALGMLYQRVPRGILSEAINVEGQALDKLIAARTQDSGWVVEQGARGSPVIKLPSNEENTPSLKKASANNIPLEQVARLLPVLSKA